MKSTRPNPPKNTVCDGFKINVRGVRPVKDRHLDKSLIFRKFVVYKDEAI